MAAKLPPVASGDNSELPLTLMSSPPLIFKLNHRFFARR